MGSAKLFWASALATEDTTDFPAKSAKSCTVAESLSTCDETAQAVREVSKEACRVCCMRGRAERC